LWLLFLNCYRKVVIYIATTERLKSSTQDKLLAGVVDSVLNSNVLGLRLLGNGRPWQGESLKKTIKYQSSGQGGAFVGIGNFSTAATDTLVRLSFEAKGYEQPVAIPGIEKSLNAIASTKVNDLMVTKMEEAQMEMLDGVGTMLYADGTGTGETEGLASIVATSGTYGSLSRTTYPVLAATVTASGGTITLAKISTLISSVSAGSQSSQSPTLAIANETVWDLIETLFAPTLMSTYGATGLPMVTRDSRAPVRAAELKGSMGFRSITYGGVPIVKDEKCTAQYLYMLNENYLDWFGLPAAVEGYRPISLGAKVIDGVYQDVPSKNHGFNWSGWMVPDNGFGQVGHIVLLGNLVSWQPRRQGVLSGITGA
jgi:hypothetical protein